MKTSSAKAKGRKLQQFLMKKLLDKFNLDEGDIESRAMGSQGTDLAMSPKARGIFPLSVECKNSKVFPSLAALRQSEANRYDGTWAAACWHPPGAKYDDSIIYMTVDKFIEMIYYFIGRIDNVEKCTATWICESCNNVNIIVYPQCLKCKKYISVKPLEDEFADLLKEPIKRKLIMPFKTVGE